MDQDKQADRLIDALIERQGGYVNHPADRGGPTNFGIAAAVARAQGYAGSMRDMPRSEAELIYRRLYWTRPGLDAIARLSQRVSAELFDNGVNMGPAVAVTFLQRALTALNRSGKDYLDLVPDGRIGPATLAALEAFFGARGTHQGETVLLGAPRGVAGRALPAPCRTPSGQRGVPLRLAG